MIFQSPEINWQTVSIYMIDEKDEHMQAYDHPSSELNVYRLFEDIINPEKMRSTIAFLDSLLEKKDLPKLALDQFAESFPNQSCLILTPPNKHNGLENKNKIFIPWELGGDLISRTIGAMPMLGRENGVKYDSNFKGYNLSSIKSYTRYGIGHLLFTPNISDHAKISYFSNIALRFGLIRDPIKKMNKISETVVYRFNHVTSEPYPEGVVFSFKELRIILSELKRFRTNDFPVNKSTSELLEDTHLIFKDITEPNQPTTNIFDIFPGLKDKHVVDPNLEKELPKKPPAPKSPEAERDDAAAEAWDKFDFEVLAQQIQKGEMPEYFYDGRTPEPGEPCKAYKTGSDGSGHIRSFLRHTQPKTPDDPVRSDMAFMPSRQFHLLDKMRHAARAAFTSMPEHPLRVSYSRADEYVFDQHLDGFTLVPAVVGRAKSAKMILRNQHGYEVMAYAVPKEWKDFFINTMKAGTILGIHTDPARHENKGKTIDDLYAQTVFDVMERWTDPCKQH